MFAVYVIAVPSSRLCFATKSSDHWNCEEKLLYLSTNKKTFVLWSVCALRNAFDQKKRKKRKENAWRSATMEILILLIIHCLNFIPAFLTPFGSLDAYGMLGSSGINFHFEGWIYPRMKYVYQINENKPKTKQKQFENENKNENENKMS